MDGQLGQMSAEARVDQKVMIRGYADRIGPEGYKQVLSQRRADAVRDYLIARGLVPSYIETAGLGSSDPVAECPKLRGAALVDCLAPNRRTEVEFSAVEVTEVEETVPVK